MEAREKPQILVDSIFGDSHPGSAHLLELVNLACQGVSAAGGRAARYFATDICDGMAQGHDGINYSLASRDAICNLIEIHERATTFDAGVFLASCDKAVPAHLMAIGRTNLPTVMVTGGVMSAGPNLLTLEQIGMYSAMCARGEITEEEALSHPQRHYITPAVVLDCEIRVEFSQAELGEGDAVLLCSDGLYNYADPTDFPRLVREALESGDASGFIDAANAGGGGDNITAVILSGDVKEKIDG